MKGISHYLKLLFGHDARPGIQTYFEEIEKANAENDPPIILLEAPTSYGKTEASIALAAWLVKESVIADRLIHVLPLRAIVEESYEKAKESLERYFPDIKVGAQAMYLDKTKTPFFLGKLVYTTIDSFVYNLFKLPVAEPGRDHSHFDIPRYAIYSSFVVFDEAHFFAGDDPPANLREHANRMFAAFKASLAALVQGRVPVAVVTATMPRKFIEEIKNTISVGSAKLIHIKVDVEASRTETEGEVKLHMEDREFFEKRKNLEAKTRIIKNEEILKTIETHHSSSDNILVVRNTVKKAQDLYKQLEERGIPSLLLHGRLTMSDKQSVLQEAKSRLEKKNCVLISTQIIEAGVDLDFDVILTDAAPMTNLIQRVGRVGRKNRPRAFYAYIIEGDGDGVYDPDLTSRSIGELINERNRQGDEFYVGWRMPRSEYIGGHMVPGAGNLLEKIYRDWSPFWDKELEQVLKEVDRYWQIYSAIIRQYEQKFCSLIRDSGVVPLAIVRGGNEFQSSEELYKKLIGCLISVNSSFLIKNWRKILDVDESQKKVRYVAVSQNGISIKDSKEIFDLLNEPLEPCRFVRRWDEFVKEASDLQNHPVALKVRDEAYTYLGLVI
ncbi:MAG: CRISPR-associated helicase Cas3' [Candidatus Hadarchaeales archaeon]